jgi:retron-type reverse transcriptase
VCSFTSLDQSWLVKFLEHRIADRRVLRLIGKWLAAGVIEDGEWSNTEQGTAQGASVSPLLANVYLHTCSTCGPTNGAGATRAGT